MPTEEQETTTEGTTSTEGEGQKQAPTPTTGGNGEQQTVEINDKTQLPDTHPLVLANAKYKSDLATQKTELAEARAQAKQVTKLEQERDARPTPEALETLQTRYDRLESFLQAIGGPVSKALDSRTFTKQLFETEDDVADIVKSFMKANPTATAQALASTAGTPTSGKQDPNELIRAAFKGSK